MIKLNERFYINASSHCYILQEKTTIQDETSKNFGQEIFKDLGYFTTLEGVLKRVFTVTTREFINKETENTLKDLVKFVRQEQEYLKGLKLDEIK